MRLLMLLGSGEKFHLGRLLVLMLLQGDFQFCILYREIKDLRI